MRALNTGGAAVSHKRRLRTVNRVGEEQGQSMLLVRKYSSFVALSFGVLFTIVWMALIAWFPANLIALAIIQILSDIAS